MNKKQQANLKIAAEAVQRNSRKATTQMRERKGKNNKIHRCCLAVMCDQFPEEMSCSLEETYEPDTLEFKEVFGFDFDDQMFDIRGEVSPLVAHNDGKLDIDDSVKSKSHKAIGEALMRLAKAKPRSNQTIVV